MFLALSGPLDAVQQGDYGPATGAQVAVVQQGILLPGNIMREGALLQICQSFWENYFHLQLIYLHIFKDMINQPHIEHHVLITLVEDVLERGDTVLESSHIMCHWNKIQLHNIDAFLHSNDATHGDINFLLKPEHEEHGAVVLAMDALLTLTRDWLCLSVTLQVGGGHQQQQHGGHEPKG